MTTKHYVSGHFVNEQGKKQEFVSMKLFADHAKAFAYERQVARELRDGGCTSIVLRTH